jgi:hypothetical protein
LAERKRRAKAAAAAAAAAEDEDETADQLAAAKTFRDFDSVRSLLLHKHPESAVLGLKKRKFTQKSLVKFILESGDNSASPLNHVGGFVVIESGRETRKDLLGQQFAFCVQRDTLKETDLGSFTTLQAGWQWGKEAAKRLTTVKSNTSTVSRTSFHDRGAALSLDAFRFLVRERGLAGYRIRHVSLVFFFGGRSSVTSVNLIFFLLQFVFYHVNQTLNPYLEKLLQSRRDLQLAGDKTKEIFREVQKLAFNGERERAQVQHLTDVIDLEHHGLVRVRGFGGPEIPSHEAGVRVAAGQVPETQSPTWTLWPRRPRRDRVGRPRQGRRQAARPVVRGHVQEAQGRDDEPGAVEWPDPRLVQEPPLLQGVGLPEVL